MLKNGSSPASSSESTSIPALSQAPAHHTARILVDIIISEIQSQFNYFGSDNLFPCQLVPIPELSVPATLNCLPFPRYTVHSSTAHAGCFPPQSPGVPRLLQVAYSLCFNVRKISLLYEASLVTSLLPQWISDLCF